ncbi:NAD-dependent epimerase/dehydratase family protein [Streptomyces sp. NPDC052101]|uniref:NAD-dependent epimerase/dehydratase family protein n=1 Tax=Streptomyces sp. NPDC052101 TaxID=3155763 RepID=UPI00343F9EF7
MEIIGRGFIARSLESVAGRHPGATVLAAGVSSTSVQAPEEFARETAMVDDVTRRCRREGRLLVYLSTASHAMYGSTDAAADENTPVAPESPYGRQKLRLEQAITASGVRSLILRLSHVTGPGQPDHHLLPAFVRQIRGGTVRLYRGAHRDLVDVADVIGAIDGLIGLGVHDVVNVASGVPRPVEELVEGIERRMGAAPRHEVVEVTPVSTTVSVDRLCALLPALRPVREPDYLDRILNRYVRCY